MSALRRSGLLLAVAASLSLRASAQSDAAFASALGRLPSGLAVLARLKTASQAPAPAQVQGPIAPAALWTKVFDNAKAYGEVTHPDGPLSISYGIDQKLTFKPNLHEQLFSMDFLARSDESGRILPVAGLFTVVEAVYKPATKQTTRHSWVFETNGSGRLTSAKRYFSTFTKSAGGETTRTDAPVEIMALDAELTTEAFTAMLEFWAR